MRLIFKSTILVALCFAGLSAQGMNYELANDNRVVVTSSGYDHIFIPGNALLITGSLYNAIVGIGVVNWAYSKYERYDYITQSYITSEYYSSFYTVFMGPQSSVFVTGGILTTAALYKQQRTLMDAGVSAPHELNALCAVLYGASIATNTCNFLSLLGESRSAVTLAAVINTAVLSTSAIMTNIAYVKQKKMLRAAGLKKSTGTDIESSSAVSVLPYVSANIRQGEVGLAVRF